MVRRIAVLAGTLMLVTPAFGQKPLAFSSVPFPTLGGAAPGAIADFNGDGKLDIVFAPAGFPPAPLQLLLGNGDGTFHAGPASSPNPKPDRAKERLSRVILTGSPHRTTRPIPASMPRFMARVSDS